MYKAVDIVILLAHFQSWIFLVEIQSHAELLLMEFVRQRKYKANIFYVETKIQQGMF